MSYFIDSLYVKVTHRSKGVGSALLSKAQSIGYGLVLYCDPFGEGGLDKESLERWYLRHGFKAGVDGLYRWSAE